MRKFDTKIQYLKYKVLKEVARRSWNDELLETILDIPKKIVSGKEATMRCCQTANYNRVQQQIKIPSDTYQTARSCL